MDEDVILIYYLLYCYIIFYSLSGCLYFSILIQQLIQLSYNLMKCKRKY